ncbi:hypothetical protein DFH09DRAFT_517365 [Mycena vulgaris]|nr:hypothetical protein DFH09DRAFT_517365 [Mycena vulgaris]
MEITETVDVQKILDKLRLAEWSSVLVTTAFYKRAIIAQQLTNFCTNFYSCMRETWVARISCTLISSLAPSNKLRNCASIYLPYGRSPNTTELKFFSRFLPHAYLFSGPTNI